MRKYVLLLIITLVMAFSQELFATHIRAADITAERIGLTRYRIRLSVYTDFNNVADNPNSKNPINVENFDIGFGDQKNPLDVITVKRKSVKEIVSGETFENIYEVEYDFPAAGNGYKIYFVGQNRNENVINLSNSINSLIYVETFVFIDAFSPVNTSPKFTVPPIDIANVNKLYTHNPGAYDADGDSISFEMIQPKDRVDKVVDGYRSPDDPSFGTPSDFKIDVHTGQITWDTPKKAGEYNIAFRVNEYRNGVRIGYVIRDMQINVLESINNPPVVEKPLETCIATGEKYSSRIQASDPDGNTIEVQLYGGFVEQGGSIETIFNQSASLKLIDLKWTPTCSAISERPVQGIIRVVDYHPSSLSAVEEWEVQVIGAAINGLNVVADDKHFNLSWNPYSCARENAIIEIFRAECDTSNIKRAKCTSGVPSSWGFTKIGEVSSTSTSFVDDGSVLGISSGVTYYYILSVKFPTPSNGESYASKVVAASLSNDSPFITEVSYDKTLADKKINLSWYHFAEVDDAKYAKPFTYTLYNGTSLVDNYIFNEAENLSLVLDTNSVDLSKSFLLELYDANKNKIGSQSLAYVERLKAFGTDKALNVTWTNRNPWFYNDTLWQKIYAFKVDGDTILVDSVPGGNTMFSIPNLKNGDSVCAYVKVAYTYCIDGLDSVFYAYTNTSCALIKDNLKPCAPALSIKNINCEQELVANELSWINQFSVACSDDILSYRLFKQEQVNQGNFKFFKETTNEFLSFDDVEGQELNCYYITAKDSSGNESTASNIVCQDFCGELILPNVFTPNNDGKNDVFTTKTNFSGFSNPVFLVYNRWGKEVYRDSDFKHLEWDGIASNGEKLSDGTYYIYISAQRLTGAQDLLEYKGWLQIMR